MGADQVGTGPGRGGGQDIREVKSLDSVDIRGPGRCGRTRPPQSWQWWAWRPRETAELAAVGTETAEPAAVGTET